MFSGNSFGALAMESDDSAGPSFTQLEGDEVDVDYLKLVKTNHDVNLRVSDKVDLNGLPQHTNLIAVSNGLGLLIVGSNSDVKIHRLQDVHKELEGAAKDASPVCEPLVTLSLHARPVWIRLAMDETRLVVATADGSGLFLWRLMDAVNGNTNPYHIFTSNIPSLLSDVIPNPSPPAANEALSHYVLLLTDQGFVIIDIEACQMSAPLPGQFTCASWSVKGKQMVCGTTSGTLVQYTPEGVEKAAIPSPPDLDPSFRPTFVHWLETDLFLVCYASSGALPDDPLELFIIHRQKSNFTYTKFFDPLNSMGVPGRSGAHRHFVSLSSWGDKTRHLSFMMSGLASEIAVMRGEYAAEKEPPKWEVLILEETARGIMPAAKEGLTEDTSCLGLALDLTSQKVVRRGVVAGEDKPDLSPVPRLLAYSQEGFIVSFDIQFDDVPQYPGMITSQAIASSSSFDTASMTQMTSAPSPMPPTEVKSTFGFSGFGSGSSAFGSPATPTRSPQPASTTPTAFGQTSTTTPFGTPTKPVAFGASSFGQPATATSTTATASAFGTPSNPTAFATTTPSAFGTSSKLTAFASPAFGQSTSPAFGQTSFGQSTTPATFGKSAFGSSAPSVTPSAFGQSSTPVAFGAPAFGSPKTSASTPSASGQPSQLSVSPSPAFGTPASTSLGFGAFGSPKPSASSAPAFGFGTSAFGSSTAGTSKPTVTPFGTGGSLGTTSAFGSNSAFGVKPPDPPSEPPKPSFSGFGAQPTPADDPDSPPVQGTFGLGGFGSALETSSVVPGLEDSPPTSPLGGRSKPSGLDDSPPPSPPLQPVKSSGSSVTASFIKPSTAFATPSSFGVFGQLAQAKPAFSTSATPAAFSAPPVTTTVSPSSGAPAFGQSSTIRAPSTASAFGSSGFGQSSVPKASAFGQAPSSGGSGNVAGGFSAFSAKTMGTSETSSATGGFGGFAAKSGGASAFGNVTTGGSFASLWWENGGEDGKGHDPCWGTKPSTPVFSFKTPEAETKVENLTTPLFSFKTAKSSDPPSQPSLFTSPVISTASSPEPGTHIPPSSHPAPEGTVTSPAVSPTPENKTEDSFPIVGSAAQAGPQSDKLTVPAFSFKPSQEGQTTFPSPFKTLPPTTPLFPSGPSSTSTEPTSSPIPRVETPEIPNMTSPPIEVIETPDGAATFSDPLIIEATAESSDFEGSDETEDQDREVDEISEGQSEHVEEFSEGEASEEEDEDHGYATEDYEEETEGDEGVPPPDLSTPIESPLKHPEPVRLPTSFFGSNQTSQSSQPSLFSRLSPAPSSEEHRSTPEADPPLFSLPTSHTTSSSTPPSTQVKSETPASSTKPSLFSGFPGFGTAASASTSPAPSTSTPLSSKPSFVFKHATRTSSPLGTHPPQSASDVNLSPEKPAPFGGLGLGKPPAKPVFTPLAPPSTSSLDKPVTSVFSPKPSSPATTFTAQTPTKQSSSLAKSGAITPTAPSQSRTDDREVVTFKTPPRPKIPASVDQPPPKTESLATLLDFLITDLQAGLNKLRHSLESRDKYHKSLSGPSIGPLTLDTIANYEELPFSSLDQVKDVVEQLSERLETLRNEEGDVSVELGLLQAGMLRSDMRVGQAEKFLKARQDPAFASAMQVRELNPQQSEAQIRVRKSVQNAEHRLDELESLIAGLKRKDRHSISTPALERVQRSVRNVDAAIRSRQETIEDLSHRISSMRLNTPTRHFGTRSSPSPFNNDIHGSPKSLSLSPSNSHLIFTQPEVKVTFEPSAEMREAAERALDRDARRNDLRDRLKDLKVKEIKAERPKGKEVVMIDALPVPRLIQKSKPTQTSSISSSLSKTDIPNTSTPGALHSKIGSGAGTEATNSRDLSGETGMGSRTNNGDKDGSKEGINLSTPSTGFGNIKLSLSLSPAELITTPTPSNRPSTRSVHHKAHERAPKLTSAFSEDNTSDVETKDKEGSVGISDSPIRMPGGDFFTFNPPTNGPQMKEVKTPKGFFSLSGFGNTS
ncbi:hypothetical protein TREMEDRAFT_74106 [Tremella mesenterica DSM 1558]|uniref:uncharacterized protein n=1 Tax=Tremella mesenterica (strain ATCC 24925 / CBS 8224 / DSM 1558 / NBRC 9311 / NRRL Y-6157 / RJB 2259-6 / UBC 559-6) TaxID=578456 RepID=UPI0003F494E6|nr:uncharacterized protein TREMEDRAFT_74106 [Tremella mesenterica DSM 1558]EIW68597.1 hypothetical protein TREMEDRAFT_74106 [Tremella mesenterica DSM 1558]